MYNDEINVCMCELATSNGTQGNESEIFLDLNWILNYLSMCMQMQMCASGDLLRLVNFIVAACAFKYSVLYWFVNGNA